MRTFTFEQFLTLFNLPKPPSFEMFCQNVWVSRNNAHPTEVLENRTSLVLDYFEKNAKDKDFRWDRRMEFMQAWYDITVTNRIEVLREWFRQHVEIASASELFRFPVRAIAPNANTPIVFNGKQFSRYNRLPKNLNFEQFYNTKKYVKHDHRDLWTTLKVMFEEHTICHSLVVPTSFNFIANKDLTNIFAMLRGTTNRPSAFNPYMYGEILGTLFTGKKLFTPVLGWNSYQIAFHNSDFTDYVGIDVIPSVIENGNSLARYSNDDMESNPLFFGERQNVELICKPSEQVYADGDFAHHYGTCDAVLFSPPYYNLELYDSDNQSIDSFPDYEGWLEGYWRPTVKLCHDMLKPGGKMAFVISDYTDFYVGRTYEVSKDMRRIVLEHFKEICTHRIAWNSFKTSDAVKMKEGNFEDVHYAVKE